jgi:hypothetical protein
MTQEERNDYLDSADVTIREACGGWIVVAPCWSSADPTEWAYDVHVFTEAASVLAFVADRLTWIKTNRNRASFGHGDDYPGDPSTDVVPPTLGNAKKAGR